MLEGLGTTPAQGAGLALADDEKCKQSSLGIFGMALGGACHTAPLGAMLLLGSETGDFDGDGDTDCDDLAAAESKRVDGQGGPGLLMNLVCGDIFKTYSNITTLASQETKGSSTEAMGISFKDFAGNGVGSWTAGNAASYPANVRIWGGTTIADMTGMIAMNLTSVNKGALYLKRLASPAEAGSGISGRVDFSNTTGASCKTTPNSENCNFQQIKFYGGEGEIVDGPPNSFNLRIFADNKLAPTFLALEGRYRYSDASAARTFGTDPATNARNFRQIYFRAVQKGGQIWGRFIFRDGAAAQITTYTVGNTNDLAGYGAEAGFCYNLGVEAAVPCTDVNYLDYASLWQGEEVLENLTASPAEVDWTGAPARQELCRTGTVCATW